MNVHAVTAEKPFNVAAAVERLSPTTRRLMASAGIVPAGRLTIAEIDRKLASASRPLSAEERMAIKIALERGGLLEG